MELDEAIKWAKAKADDARYMAEANSHLLSISKTNATTAAALDALRAAAEAGRWRPIETAPKDGTKVDLWVQRQIGLSAGPGRLPDCWYSSGKWWVYDDYGDDQCRSEVRHATRWRPLPPAPEA